MRTLATKSRAKHQAVPRGKNLPPDVLEVNAGESPPATEQEEIPDEIRRMLEAAYT